jgi:hypothetical protein
MTKFALTDKGRAAVTRFVATWEKLPGQMHMFNMFVAAEEAINDPRRKDLQPCLVLAGRATRGGLDQYLMLEPEMYAPLNDVMPV